MITHTIDSVEERLKLARQQVADFEALLHQLKLEERAKPPSSIHHDTLQESETSSFLQGSTLQLIVEWLKPLELVNCLLVSKRWKQEIDRPLIWKQAGSRAIPCDLRNVMDDFPLEVNYYKKMCMAIVEKPRRQVDIIAERQNNNDANHKEDHWLPMTTLVSTKVFLIVEVYWKETSEIFGTWVKSFAQWVPSESDLGFQMIDVDKKRRGAVQLPAPPLAGRLDDHFREFYNPDPTTDVPTYIYDSIAFSFRCVRTDTGETLHLGKDQDFDQYDTALWAYLDADIGAPTARNDAGCRARDLWSCKEFQRGGVCLRFNVRPIPSPPDTNNNNTRQSSWHGTTYLLDGLECDFVAYRQDGSYEDFKNLRELLVSLDGYLWS